MSDCNTISLVSVPIHSLDMASALDRIDGFISTREPHYNIAINAAKIVGYQTDPQLRSAIQDAHLLTADGQAVVWAARLMGNQLPERLAGSDLMEELLQHAAHRGYSIYLLGARREVVATCVKRASELYPQLKIVGFRDGYFTKEEEFSVVEKVRAANPDILFLGFGTPAKEYFMHRWHRELQVPFVMGVGGTFDVFAGLVKRAPRWMQRNGMEWLFRLAQEPRRMWKRYLVGNTQFVLLIAREFIDARLRRT